MSSAWRRRSQSTGFRTVPSSVRSSSSEHRYQDEVLARRCINGTARSIEYDGDRRVWTAEADGRIVLRGALRGDEVMEVAGREASFCTVLRRVSSKQMWAAFTDGFIRSYDTLTGEMKSEFVQHDGAVNCITASPRSDYAYSGGNDWKVYQWSKSSCTYLRLFSGHTNAVRCIYVDDSAGGRSVSLDTQQKSEDDAGNGDGKSSCVSLTEVEEEFFVSGSDDMTIKVWDLRAPLQNTNCNSCVGTLRGHQGSVLALAVCPLSGELWSGSEDCSLRVWRWRPEEKQRSVMVLDAQHGAPVTEVVYVAPRMWSSGKDGFVVVWDGREMFPLCRFQPCGHPISSMRLLYRSAHWVLWMGGHESPISVVHATGNLQNIEARLRRHEPSCKAVGQRKKIDNLQKRNKMLEERVQRLLRSHSDVSIADARGDVKEGQQKVVQDRKKAEMNVLKASSARLEARDKRQKNPIEKAEHADEAKDKLINSLKRSLSDKEAALDSMGRRYKALKARQGNLSSTESPELASKEILSEDAHSSLSRPGSLIDGHANGMERQQAVEKERDALQSQLLVSENYKALWEAKDDALRKADEKIQELQRNLENEEQRVSELLKELAESSQKGEITTSDHNSMADNSPSRSSTQLHRSTHHHFKRLPGTKWNETCVVYLNIMLSTLVEDFDEMSLNENVIVKDVIYAPTNDSLLVDFTLEHLHTEKYWLQSAIELYPFRKTVALHDSLSTHHPQQERKMSHANAGGCKAVVSEKDRADAEREETLQRLQKIEEELEDIYDQKRQAEDRRARIAGLPSKVKTSEIATRRVRSTSPRATKPPLYCVTAEEYETVVAARDEANVGRENALQRLRGAEEELASAMKKGNISDTHSSPNTSARKEYCGHQNDFGGARPALYGNARRSPQSPAADDNSGVAARSASVGGAIPKWCPCRYVLGNNAAPLVDQYRQLVEDVFVMEVCRAVSVPLDHVRCLRFLSDGSVVEVEVRQTRQSEDPNKLLERHPFSVLKKLLELGRLMTSSAHPVSGMGASSAVNRRTVQLNDEQGRGQERVPVRTSTAMSSHDESPSRFSSDIQLKKEVEFFRSRRLLANRMRTSEQSLQTPQNLQSTVDRGTLDLSVLQREPVYCVTLDEYRRVLEKLDDAVRDHVLDDSNEEEDIVDPTRLWNMHVLLQAEEERQLRLQMSHEKRHC